MDVWRQCNKEQIALKTNCRVLNTYRKTSVFAPIMLMKVQVITEMIKEDLMT